MFGGRLNIEPIIGYILIFDFLKSETPSIPISRAIFPNSYN